MPIFTVNVISAMLTQEFVSPSPSQDWKLSFRAKLSGDDRFRHIDGAVIDNIEFYVSVRKDQGENKEWFERVFPNWDKSKEPKGILVYSESTKAEYEILPPSISLYTFLPNESVNDLLEMARGRLFPSEIVVHIFNDYGMKYGWEPDGRGKEWNTKDHPRLPVEAISFRIPLSESKTTEDLVAEVPKPQNSPDLVKWQIRIFWALAFIAALLFWRLRS